MKKFIPSLLIATLFASCNGKSEHIAEQSAVSSENSSVNSVPDSAEAHSTAPTTSYRYSILDKEVSDFVLLGQPIKKIRYTVEIPSEYTKDALDEIADVIKYEENIPYVFVEFYISGQPRTGTNYGIAKRTPAESTSEINYIAPPEEPVKSVQPNKPIKKPYDGCKVYGAWRITGGKVIAYQKNGKCYMVNYFGGSNFQEPELYIKTTYRGRTAFKNAEDPADMYVINTYGDLDGYYEGDLCTTFPQTIY